MKILAVAVMSVAFLCLLSFSLGQVDRYKVSIVERGAAFSEEIEIDEKQNAEVFRVPSHNDVDAADFYHDFKKRLTVTRMRSRKACYIAEMDPSMPSPMKLKDNLAKAASHAGQLPVRTQYHSTLVTGHADRLSLTKEILDFCGNLPIYETEVVEKQTENGTITVNPRRQRRNTDKPFTTIISCLQTVTQGKKDSLTYVINGGCVSRPETWLMKCQMKRLNKNCFYYVSCRRATPTPAIGDSHPWDCWYDHKGGPRSYAYCCDPVCPN